MLVDRMEPADIIRARADRVPNTERYDELRSVLLRFAGDDDACAALADELARNARLLEVDPALISDKLSVLQALLLDTETGPVRRIVVRCPSLLTQRPELLAGKVDDLAIGWDVPRSEVVAAMLTAPTLFNLDFARVLAETRALATALPASMAEVAAGLLRSPTLIGRDPDLLVCRARMCARIARYLGDAEATAQRVISSESRLLIYGNERLRERYRLARLGCWRAGWRSLVCWEDKRLVANLARSARRLSDDGPVPRRIHAMLACYADRSDKADLART